MTPQRLQLVEQIFGEAISLEESRRLELIRSRCGEDTDLAREVLALIDCADIHEGMLDQGAPALVDLPGNTEDQSHLKEGTRIGPYTIRSTLGVGGMGVVYLGEQARPRRTVAIKVIRPGFATPSMLRRFEYEAELLGRLQHPGIAHIIEAGTAQTPFGLQPFFAMELVNGVPLTRFAKEQALDIRACVQLFVRICEAVEHAHQRGVVHRDLKPANIFVNDQFQPKVLDFGVARATGGREAEQRLTLLRTGERQLVGTIAYMSPEQITGDAAQIDTRSDVYSLGVILFEVLSGALPIDVRDRSLPDAVRMIRDEDPRRLGKLQPACRGDLETICAKAIEKRPRDRYQSAAQFASDLQRFLVDAPIEARPPSAVYHLRKFARRNRGLVAGFLIACGAITAGAIFGAVQYAHAVKARAAAESQAAEADRLRASAVAEAAARARESANLRHSLLFMQDYVLTQAYDQNGDMGYAASILDSLRSAQPDLKRQFRDDPLSEARLSMYSGLIFDANAQFESGLAAEQLADELYAGLGKEIAEEQAVASQAVVRNLARLGRFAEAERLGIPLAELPMADSAQPHPNSIAVLAFVYGEEGRFGLAEPLYRRQFEMALHDPHASPLNTYVQTRRLASLLLDSGRLDEFQALWNERIAAAAAHFGSEGHRAPLQFINECAGMLEDAGHVALAQDYRRRAFAAIPARERFAAEANEPFWLAANLRRTATPGCIGEAADLTDDILSHARASAGARSTWLHRAAAEHIRSLLAAHRTDQAVRLGADAMAAYHFETGDWKYRVSAVRQACAEALLASGDPVSALPLARAEFDRRSLIRGISHPLTIESLKTLAACLTAAGRESEVAPLCRATLAAQLETCSVRSPATLSLAQACVSALLDASRADEAERIARQILDQPLCDAGRVRKAMVELRCLLACALAQRHDAPDIAQARAQLASLIEEITAALGAQHPWVTRVRAAMDALPGRI